MGIKSLWILRYWIDEAMGSLNTSGTDLEVCCII